MMFGYGTFCYVLQSGAVKVSREGYILFQFAPAVGGGTRLYDWNRKQVIMILL